MARSDIDDNDEKPLDPAVEKVRRKLVRFVAINLGLLFLALMAVLGAIVYKSGAPEGSATASGETALVAPADGGVIAGDIVLPAGARLLAHSISANRISLDTELSGGGRAILIYDMGERRIIGRFDLKAE
ncbi:MAG: fimbrial protein [Pseudaminobacter sp.]|nr:fimbrial protein [Pseudaminobacter sp.]